MLGSHPILPLLYVTIKLVVEVTSRHIQCLYMRVSNALAINVIQNSVSRKASRNIKYLYMRESNTHAINVFQNSVSRVPSNYINCLYMREKNVVYVAKVLRLDNFHEERYTGVHEGPFKTRLYGHNHDIKHRPKKGRKGTRLSNYIWKLKDNQPHPIPYELEWDILGKEKPYNQVTGVCRLCLFEAYFLMFDEANSTLNSRAEYFSACPHKRIYLLKYS